MEKANQEEAQKFAHDLARKLAEPLKPYADASVLAATEMCTERGILAGIWYAAIRQAEGENIAGLEDLPGLLDEPEDEVSDK